MIREENVEGNCGAERTVATYMRGTTYETNGGNQRTDETNAKTYQILGGRIGID